MSLQMVVWNPSGKTANEMFLFTMNCLAKPMSARITYNVLQLPVVGVWNTQLSIPTNVYLKIQMFVSKAKTN